jgi:DNA replication protein DnaC
MAVSVHDATPSTSGNSYTTSGDATSAEALEPPAELEAAMLTLKMEHARQATGELLIAAREQGWDHAEFLRRVLAEEAMGRADIERAARIRAAGFPHGKSFASWQGERSSIPAEVQQALIALEWARRSENLVIAGPSGTGKSYLVEALCRHAIDAGMRVCWNSLESLSTLLAKAKIDQSVTRTIARICRADLIVIDDIGVLPVEPIQDEAFYRIIDSAYERRALAVTTNTHPQRVRLHHAQDPGHRRDRPAAAPRAPDRDQGRVLPVHRGQERRRRHPTGRPRQPDRAVAAITGPRAKQATRGSCRSRSKSLARGRDNR